MDFITGPTIAVMFYQATCFWGCEPTYVAAYRDLETCRARIEQIEKNVNHLFKNQRWCNLEAVVQKTIVQK